MQQKYIAEMMDLYAEDVSRSPGRNPSSVTRVAHLFPFTVSHYQMSTLDRGSERGRED
jgi:hypothetical protein